MIPVLSIANLISAVISLIIATKLWMRHRDKEVSTEVSAGVKRFITFYGVFGLMWLFYGSAGVISNDPNLISFLQTIADILVYIGSVVGVQISFIAMNKNRVGTALSVVCAALGLLYLFVRLSTPTVYTPTILPPYIYWQPASTLWLTALTGSVASLASLIFASTFFILGVRAKNNAIVWSRSLSLSAGMTCILIASTLFFLFATGGFITASLASLFAVTGLLVMLKGVPQ